nr:nuclear transport factor 2 family protein [Kibdelosporangium sp. MJ126-NF4]CEL13235.1 Ketosteroid isomerase-related protein [Kibdelosporangium sp. MJ126-NF4]CTQ98926.1 Ketosteroid isomerase-related protein [Kibdelosporangium sp. MJ126-NF4]
MSSAALVRKVFDLFGEARLTEIRDLLSDDFEWTFFGPEELPWADTYLGHEGFDRFFATVAKHIEVEQFDVSEYIEAGDRVVAIGTSSARFLRTDVRYHTNWINVFTVNGGKITRLLDLYETATVVEALRVAAAGEHAQH